MKVSKRNLKRIMQEVLLEMDMNQYYDRMPESSLDNLIPAGHLEDILASDGLGEWEDELAFHCEMLENRETGYHLMEPAEHRYIVDAMEDLAEDGNRLFLHWLAKSAFDNVIVGDDATEANYIRWTMR